MSDKFEWNEDESVVIRAQPAIAVQGDQNGDLLIRQEGQPNISEDQFLDVRHENVLVVCRDMLRKSGYHRYTIVAVDEIGVVNGEGKELRIPRSDLEKLDRIAEEGRLEDVAHQVRWQLPAKPAQTQPRSRDSSAAERKRRQRQKERETKAVTPSQPVTPVTRDTVTTTPRLPAELDLLQHRGGAKQPAG